MMVEPYQMAILLSKYNLILGNCFAIFPTTISNEYLVDFGFTSSKHSGSKKVERMGEEKVAKKH